MTSPGMQPQKSPKSSLPPRPATTSGKVGDMPSINSVVGFDSTCGVTIDVGAIDSTVTNVKVFWGDSTTPVYDSNTPNAAGQSTIPAGTATAGSSYVVTLKTLYANWTRPNVYGASVTAAANSSPQVPLPRTQRGGT